MGIKVVKPPEKNTFINKRKANFKSFNCTFLPVGTNYKNSFRSLLKFDLSCLPPFLNILNGTLNLYLIENDFPDETKTVTVHQLLSEWNERSVSFNHQPLYNPTPLSGITLKNQNNLFISFDVTPLIESWYSGTEANLGVMLKMSNEIMPEIIFLSKEYPHSKFWPFLEIKFSDPANSPCCHPIELAVTVITDNSSLSTHPLNTLMFNYTYIIVNVGSNPAMAVLQSSPDSCHWREESAVKTIEPGQTENLVPDFIAKYSRLCYKSAINGRKTTLEIHIQGRS